MSTCADHTKAPVGYVAWWEWAEKKMKRHYQIRCDECGLFKIWKRKPEHMADDEFPMMMEEGE